ncbi:aminopeptidase P family protein [Fusobacterium sp.]|uniref:aminopeptidase P family protein n=1 Tax=Fusobacterium sp. TaxID=68766 RepID=UPI00261FAF71|nr:aminopeptidase P family protein [Fusobacterium sp.]
MFSKEVYMSRRKKLKEEIKNGIILVCGNELSPMNCEDNTYPFMQDSTFLYYFGLDRENLFGIIDVDNDKDYIFGNELTMDDIIWMGPQVTLKEQCESVGIENVHSLDELNEFMTNLQKEKKTVHYIPQYRHSLMIKMADWFKVSPNDINKNISENLCFAVANQRNIKTPEEIEEIEKAVNITRDMHLAAMKDIKPGMMEYEVDAILENISRSQNSGLSFPTICTINGQTLHNHYHGNKIKEGDLLLIDAGARIESGYCGDMTTTHPVSGKFTERQRDIYNLLISMFDKAEELIKPGITYLDVHLAVCKVLAKGMIERNILKGNPDEIVKNGVHALFMPHGLGHMMGLDVHDMENIGEPIVGYNGNKKSSQFGLSSLRLGRTLETGFVFTVEPGIYFIPELISKWKSENKFSEYINYDELEKYLDFGGMRYEGDYLVTENGNRRLGNKMPKYPDEIEAIREEAFK